VTINVFGASLLPASARKAALIKRACALTLKREKVAPEGELNVIFVDRRKMLALNKKFLSHTHDTDVIAFQYAADAPGAEAFGDVYVSAFQARRQAAELGHSLLREVLTLVVHGTLHLVGYDDATRRQQAEMFRKQDDVLAALLR
jgi:probable rRNA maturation factor